MSCRNWGLGKSDSVFCTVASWLTRQKRSRAVYGAQCVAHRSHHVTAETLTEIHPRYNRNYKVGSLLCSSKGDRMKGGGERGSITEITDSNGIAKKKKKKGGGGGDPSPQLFFPPLISCPANV